MGKSSLFVSMVVAISLVFTVSCVTKEVPVTETYYETEYRTESYIEVKWHEDYLTPKWTRHAWVYFKILEWAEAGAGSYFDGYEIGTAKPSNGQVKLVLSNLSQSSLWGIQIVNLTGVGKLSAPPPRDPLQEKTVYEGGVKKIITEPESQEWLDNLNAIMTDPKRSLAFIRSEEHTGREIIVDFTGVEGFMVITCTPLGGAPVIEKVQVFWSEEVTEERQVPYQVEKQRTVMQTKKVPIWEVWQTNPETPSPATVPPAEEPSPQLIYEDDFSDPNSGFRREDTADCKADYKDGEYNVLVKRFDWAAWFYNLRPVWFLDFALGIDTRMVGGPSQSMYGVIFQVRDANNFYRFLISADGYYLIGARLDGKWTELQGWTVSPHINQGNDTNHLEVICKGSQIEVYVNGHQLTTVTDDSFATGYVGVIVVTSEPNAHVAFDNLKVYSLD